MSVNASFGGSNFTPPSHAFDHDTLQDVALACVEGRLMCPRPALQFHRLVNLIVQQALSVLLLPATRGALDT